MGKTIFGQRLLTELLKYLKHEFGCYENLNSLNNTMIKYTKFF